MHRQRHSWIALSAVAVVCGNAAHARALTPAAPWHSESGWISVEPMPSCERSSVCASGPTALQIVIEHLCGAVPAARATDQPAQANAPLVSRRVSAGALRDHARELGFDAFVVSGTFDDIKHELAHDRPVIVGVAKHDAKGNAIAHYEVVIGIQPSTNRIATLDPADGWTQNTFAGFLEEWTPTRQLLIVVLPSARGIGSACSSSSSKN